MHCSLPLIFLTLSIPAYGDANPVAQDDARQAAYGAEWTNGSNGGSGFTAWNQQMLTGSGNSNAGFYIASVGDHPDLKGATKNGKAFGLYANGINFEVASAFRGFSAPVAVGQSVSITWQTGVFERKFDVDSDAAGSVGFTLRTGNAGSGVDDYNKGARFEFGVYAGLVDYQIYDGQDDHDSGVLFDDGGVKLKFTLTGPDTYDLDITTLADQKTKTLKARKLGGAAGGTVDSLCIFDRNWEKNDAYFNDIEVLPAAAPAAATTVSPSPTASPAASAEPSSSPVASPSPAAGAPIPGVTPAGL
jgi:hypothetical protein